MSWKKAWTASVKGCANYAKHSLCSLLRQLQARQHLALKMFPARREGPIANPEPPKFETIAALFYPLLNLLGLHRRSTHLRPWHQAFFHWIICLWIPQKVLWKTFIHQTFDWELMENMLDNQLTTATEEPGSSKEMSSCFRGYMRTERTSHSPAFPKDVMIWLFVYSVRSWLTLKLCR